MFVSSTCNEDIPYKLQWQSCRKVTGISSYLVSLTTLPAITQSPVPPHHQYCSNNTEKNSRDTF